MNDHINKITKEFTKQAEKFDEYQKSFSKEEYNHFARKNMKLKGTENVLEVAAGTCGFGRSISPLVKHVTELDVTKAMLDVGKKQAEKLNINNTSFVLGIAEDLPFLDNSFDVVMSRLAFHHFVDVKKAYEEMLRVLRVGGKLVIVDMEARKESLREIADFYETLRDDSHVKCISRDEFYELEKKCGAENLFCETIQLPVFIQDWLDLTEVQEPIRTQIVDAMKEDINKGKPTGFEPYIKDEKVCFNHNWMLMISHKGHKQ